MYENKICVHENPRSGGNWVLKILSAYLRIPYRDIDRIPESVLEKTLYRWFGIPPLGKFNKVNTLNIFNYLIKTHVWNSNRYNKIIYMVRDPRDVMVSYYHYEKDFVANVLGRTPNYDFNSKVSLKEDFDGYLKFRFLTNKFPYKSWTDHVQTALSKDNIIIIKYEEMHQDPEGQICKVLNYVGKSVNHKRIKTIIENESFHNEKQLLRSQKRRFDSHLRSGRVGIWHEYYSNTALSFMQKKTHYIMNRLNYL